MVMYALTFQISLQRLACHVCSLFVEVENQSFDRRLQDFLPLLFDIIKPDKYNVQVIEEHCCIFMYTCVHLYILYNVQVIVLIGQSKKIQNNFFIFPT